MTTNKLFIIAPVLGAISLFYFRLYQGKRCRKEGRGQRAYAEIAKAISDGAKAFLAKILVVFIARWF